MQRILSALLCVAIAPGALAAQTARVSGVVVDARTASSLADVWIGPDTARSGVLTDGQGRFDIDVAVDVDSLYARRIGYGLSRFAVQPAGQTIRIELVPAGVALSGIEVRADEADAQARLRSAQSIEMLDAARIDRVRDQTLGGTVEDVPGVAVIQYGPSIAKPVVRGLHSQRVVVSSSGVRQEGQQWGGEHAPEIDVFAADRIEIIRGPGAVEHGSDAMGGVVVVEQAPVPTDPVWRGEIATQMFSNNRQGAISAAAERGALDVPLLGEVGARLRVTARRAGDAASPEFNLANTGFSELSLSGAVGWTGATTRTEVLLSRYGTRLGLFSGAHVGNFDDLQRAIERGPRETEFGYSIENPRQEVTHDKVQVRHERMLGDRGRLDLSYAFQLNRRREFDNHGPLANRDVPAFGLDLYTHTIDGAWSADRGSGTTRLGVSGMRQGNISVGKGFLIPQYRLYTGGVWASDRREFGDLTVESGVRVDTRWQRIFPPPDRGIDVEQTTDTWTDVGGGVGLAWEFASDWFVAASWGRAWRAPNVNERFSQGVHHGTAQYELGDATLQQETTSSLDASLRRDGERLSMEVAVFRNAIDNFIYLQPREPVLTIRGAFPAFEYRQTEARLVGVELDLEARATETLAFFAQGSLLRGDNRALDEPLYDMPADRLRVGVRWDGEAGGGALSAEASTLLVREQDRVPSETIYGLPTDGYQLLDVGFGWSGVRIGGHDVDLSLDVSNLLDRSYRDYLSRYRLFVDDPGRDVVLRVEVPLAGR